MEIYQLRSFITVANTGNLTQASEQLFTSQPAVSAHIKALEEEFGLKLFNRSAKGMTLTDDGLLLKEKALIVLDSSHQLKVQAESLKGELSGTVKIGLNTDSEFLRLTQWLNALMKQFPRLKIELIQGTSEKLIKDVEAGLLDVSFISKDLKNTSFNPVILIDSYGVIAAAPQWAEKIASGNIDDLASLPWIQPEPLCIYHQFINQVFKDSQKKPNFITISGSEESVINLLLGGAGIAVIREDQAEELLEKEQVVIWRKEKYYSPLSLIYQNKRENDPIIKCMTDVIPSFFQD